jgi:DNA replication and repair protein RecF
MTAVTRLTLSNFRNHRDAVVEAGAGFVLLSGPNGAGKTNVLEAVSLLTPGRGLRQVPIGEMARSDGPGTFAVAARLDGGAEIGTGTTSAAPDRRQVRINGAPSAVNSLGERLSVDRLTLALEPGHAHHAARFEAAMRARNKLLGEEAGADPDWLSALESQMAEHGLALGEARARTVIALTQAMSDLGDDDFPRASLALEGWEEADLIVRFLANRARDAAAGRTTEGPHRQDLVVNHVAKQQPASRSSTGEQKALLLGLVLAHAELVAERRGAPPILLLDEVAAHLDPDRRAALFGRLERRGQVWMTGTEAALFEAIGSGATRFHVESGTILAA